jgi:PAS domain S-box-containing protein
LPEHVAWLRGQRQALEAAINGAPLQVSLDALVRTAIHALGKETRAAFYLSDEDHTSLHHVVGMSADYARMVDGFKIGPESLACGLATHTGQPVITDDVTNDPRWEPWLWLAERFDYRGCWSFPIHSAAGKMIGTLAIYSRGPRVAGPRERELCALLTNTASIIISQYSESQARKQAEEALRESEERFRLFMDNSPTIAWVKDEDGRYVYFSRAFQQRFGVHFSEWRNRTDAELWPPDVAAEFRKSDEDVLAAGQAMEMAAETPTPNGGRLHWLVTKFPFRDAAGRRYVGGIGLEITERKRAEAELSQSLERERLRAEELETLLDLAPIGVSIALDREGRNIRGNRAQVELFGLRPGSQLSMASDEPPPIVVLQDGRPLATEELPMQRAVRGETVEGQIIDVKSGDRIVTILVKATPLFDEARRPRGAIGAFLDISALKQAEYALREADRRKDRFLATLAHELRNPLAPIYNAIHVLGRRHGGAGDPDAGLLDVMRRQVEHLVRLVDDLLEISRISRGKIELRREPVEMAAALRDALETCRPLIEKKGHAVTIDGVSESLSVYGDPARLVQVMANVLGNAAKYTRQGGRIAVELGREEGSAIFRVRDSGVGIPPDMLGCVFELFTQIDNGADCAEGGLGIGLALVRDLVDLHGGSVQAHSDGQGKGSEFTIRLPLCGRSPVSAVAAKDAAAWLAPPQRVLVIDDEPDVGDSLGLLLESLGAAVCVAYDGPSGVAAAREFKPRIVFIDLGMPAMDGFETARRIREGHTGDRFTLVAVTGWGQAEDRIRTRMAGFDLHLTKPASTSEIQALLQGTNWV